MMKFTRRTRLAARVRLALDDDAGEAELERLLTDCAAEALSARTELLRTQRQLNQLLKAMSGDAELRAEVNRITARHEQVSAEWRELSELMAELRARLEDFAGSPGGS